MCVIFLHPLLISISVRSDKKCHHYDKKILPCSESPWGTILEKKHQSSFLLLHLHIWQSPSDWPAWNHPSSLWNCRNPVRHLASSTAPRSHQDVKLSRDCGKSNVALSSAEWKCSLSFPQSVLVQSWVWCWVCRSALRTLALAVYVLCH